jgi:S1-C subfamily serine protease
MAMVLAAVALLAANTGESRQGAPGPERDDVNLAVVAIDAHIGGEQVRSSGTVIDARAGLVLTTAHTVWGATSLRLMTGVGVVHGRLLARAPCAGVALIEAQPRLPGLVALPPASGGPPPASELLTAVGRRGSGLDLVGPESLVTLPTRAAGTATARFEADLPPLARAIRLDGAIVPESSGGPVVNEDGDLVAMAMATTAAGGAQGAVGLPAATIRERIDELRGGERSIYVGWREQYRCAGRLHSYARREHPGYRRIHARINAPVPATRLPGTRRLDQ